ncbi:OpgC family protein [Chthonobacter albigriseus]|uniref:OpgC family protein n=1 Tax=Chthonobacter albigriseus TaxID=1683161 RepID=UPI0015EF5842|nr:OpgC domain-containing protein [Chthonobacter albigriseus]
MAVKSLGARDHRIDILRGLALISIFINHVPGNVLEPMTHKNFGLSDSAETFVLLAGIAAAFAYFPRFAQGARLLSMAKVVKRAGTLYVAHLASIVVGLGIMSFGAVRLGAPDLLETINIAPLLAEPAKGLIGLATMTHQIGYHNILPMYVCLLLFLPVLMWLASRSLGLMLATSVVIYFATNVYGWNVPNYPTEGGWFFNPFAWQILFAIGFFVGARVLAGQTPVPYSRPLFWVAVAYLIGAGLYHRYNLYGLIPEVPLLPHNIQINEKPWVALGRLTHVLSLAYVVGHSPLMGWLRSVSTANPLALIGRHALVVFWVGTALSMTGQVVMRVFAPSVTAQVGLLAAGILIQVAIAWGLDWAVRAEKSHRTGMAAPAPADPVREVAPTTAPAL